MGTLSYLVDGRGKRRRSRMLDLNKWRDIIYLLDEMDDGGLPHSNVFPPESRRFSYEGGEIDAHFWSEVGFKEFLTEIRAAEAERAKERPKEVEEPIPERALLVFWAFLASIPAVPHPETGELQAVAHHLYEGDWEDDKIHSVGLIYLFNSFHRNRARGRDTNWPALAETQYEETEPMDHGMLDLRDEAFARALERGAAEVWGNGLPVAFKVEAVEVPPPAPDAYPATLEGANQRYDDVFERVTAEVGGRHVLQINEFILDGDGQPDGQPRVTERIVAIVLSVT